MGLIPNGSLTIVTLPVFIFKKSATNIPTSSGNIFSPSIENNSTKIHPNYGYNSMSYLKNKNLNQIMLSQKIATENVFSKKKIPFRSFTVLRRNEKTLGELFSFFILETILIGKMLNLNPYDQPAVELIKNETKKILIKTK